MLRNPEAAVRDRANNRLPRGRNDDATRSGWFSRQRGRAQRWEAQSGHGEGREGLHEGGLQERGSEGRYIRAEQ